MELRSLSQNHLSLSLHTGWMMKKYFVPHLISLLMASSCSCSMMASVCTSVCPLGDSCSEPKRGSPLSSSSEQPTSRPGSNLLPSRAPLSQSGYCDEVRETVSENIFMGMNPVVGTLDPNLGGILSSGAPASPVTPPDHAPSGGGPKGIQVSGGACWEGPAPVGIPQLQSAAWQRATTETPWWEVSGVKTFAGFQQNRYGRKKGTNSNKYKDKSWIF